MALCFNGDPLSIITWNGDPLSVVTFNGNVVWSGSTPSGYTVSVTAPSGWTVSGTGSYNSGDWVKVQVTPPSGYVFVQWSDGSYDNPRFINDISEDISLSFTYDTAPVNNYFWLRCVAVAQGQPVAQIQIPSGFGDLEYSTDKASTWSLWDYNSTLTMEADDVVYFRGPSTPAAGPYPGMTDDNGWKLINGDFVAGGDISYIISQSGNVTDLRNYSTGPYRMWFRYQTGLLNISQIVIPFQYVTERAFHYAFSASGVFSALPDFSNIQYVSTNSFGNAFSYCSIFGDIDLSNIAGCMDTGGTLSQGTWTGQDLAFNDAFSRSQNTRLRHVHLGPITPDMRCYRNFFNGTYHNPHLLEVEFDSWGSYYGTNQWFQNATVDSTTTFQCPSDLTITYGQDAIPSGATVVQV